MTVRLRPRKVLCSKCKGICNENSENVAQTGKTKVSEQLNLSSKEKQVYLSADSTSRGVGEEESRTLIMGHSLIPKISRLHPNEITDALNGNIYARNEIWLRQSDDKSETNFEIEFDSKTKQSDASRDGNVADMFGKSDILYSSSEGNSENRLIEDNTSEGERKIKVKSSSKNEESNGPKKKRCETFITPDQDESSSGLFASARTLKISYGEGEGTVLKLPAMIGEYDATEIESKAAKRAMKKAKKQARRHTSPAPSPPHDSPFNIFKKHKHKVKQYLQNSYINHYWQSSISLDGKVDWHRKDLQDNWEHSQAMKEECLRKRLSISLERLW